MSDGVTRRQFIRNGTAAGASVAFGGSLLGGFASPTLAGDTAGPGLAAVTGPDGFANALAAVEAMGGIARYVSKGASVIINANTAFKHRGSIVSADVLLATLKLCADAGAGEVRLVKPVKQGYWERCERAAAHQALIDNAVISEREFEVVKVEGGLALEEAHVDRHLRTSDVYLNVTIAKQHRGCRFTGTLKNTMGLCPHEPTCRFFHVGANPDPDSDDWYPNLDHLSQCVADLNLVRQPDLCIVDAGEILTTNGPFGPGKLATPGAVIATADMVAADAFCVRYVGLKPGDVGMIGRAEKHGLGTTDLDAVGVRELALG
jgi:uncharacterized protein (DUF362 family)